MLQLLALGKVTANAIIVAGSSLARMAKAKVKATDWPSSTVLITSFVIVAFGRTSIAT